MLKSLIKELQKEIRTYDDIPKLDLKLSSEFNFLIISQFGIRKNLTNTIKWFVEEFKNEDVGLVVKTNLAKKKERFKC